MMRPLRVYQLTFTNTVYPGQPVLVYTRTGYTTCQAKGRGFIALEEDLRASPQLPKQGWRLLKQEDVTHLIPS